jgi:hypothetical protein
MVLAKYTHLLNYITWFNEASIQSKLNSEFGSNLTSVDVEARTNPLSLELLKDELVTTFEYFFNKPDVTSSTIVPLDPDDVTVAAVWGGVTKDLINVNTSGSALAYEKWKERGWTNVHETGLYANTFTFAEVEGTPETDHIGIAVSMLDVVIVIVVPTSIDNSVDPKRPDDPSDPSEDDRGVCTDGLDIEVCDEEEEDDDCDPVEILCDANFHPAN